MGPGGPRGGETAVAHALERGGVPMALGGANRPGSENRPPMRFHGGSPVWFWFLVVGEVAEHG
jgi:hypothetical protein